MLVRHIRARLKVDGEGAGESSAHGAGSLPIRNILLPLHADIVAVNYGESSGLMTTRMQTSGEIIIKAIVPGLSSRKSHKCELLCTFGMAHSHFILKWKQ